MDNAFFCKCDKCRALYEDYEGERVGRHSDMWFRFVNEVAKGLRESHPDKTLSTLAYMTHELPPDFKLEPNVAIHFCWSANRFPAAPGYALQRDRFLEWVEKHGQRPFYMWLYYTFPVEFAHNGRYKCFPGFFAHKVGEQFRLMAENNVKGIFHCGYGQEVEAYVTFQLMDDPSRDVDALLDDYFTGLYGPAGAPLKQFYLLVEEVYCDPGRRAGLKGRQGAAFHWEHLGTEEVMARLAAHMAAARDAADSPERRARVDCWEKGVWDYMQAGRAQYLQRREAPMPEVTAPRLPAAGGDPAKVAWDRAASLGDKWYVRGGDSPATRPFAGRIAHDGEFLYLELVDPCDVSKLEASASVFPYDDWEVFLALQRDQPYRQYAVGPKGLNICLSHGEVNWRQNVKMADTGFRVVTDTSAGDQWVTRMVFPLATVLNEALRPGDDLFMNIMRVTGPAASGTSGHDIESWVSFVTVHEVDRLARITLAK